MDYAEMETADLWCMFAMYDSYMDLPNLSGEARLEAHLEQMCVDAELESRGVYDVTIINGKLYHIDTRVPGTEVCDDD